MINVRPSLQVHKVVKYINFVMLYFIANFVQRNINNIMRYETYNASTLCSLLIQVNICLAVLNGRDITELLNFSSVLPWLVQQTLPNIREYSVSLGFITVHFTTNFYNSFASNVRMI